MPINPNGQLPDLSVTVTYAPADQSFSYSGDIDPVTEEIKVEGIGVCTISLHLEGANWAATPLKWVNAQKQAAGTPAGMVVDRIGDKVVEITDDCNESTAGTFPFLVCVDDGGSVVCSDPRVTNDPYGGP